MKIKDFYELVELSMEPEASLLPNLQYRIKKYPYFQADTFIYLKCLYLSSSEDFMDELSRLSPFISDRKALFYYIMNDQYGLFREKIEKNLNSDRTNILIGAFFDTLDESDIELTLDNLINSPSLASTDYFAYLESLETVVIQEQNNVNSIIESILPDHEHYFQDVKFKEIEHPKVDKTSLKTDTKYKRELENLDITDKVNSNYPTTTSDTKEISRNNTLTEKVDIEDELEVEDLTHLNYLGSVIKFNDTIDRIAEIDISTDDKLEIENSISEEQIVNIFTESNNFNNKYIEETNAQTTSELNGEYLSNIGYDFNSEEQSKELEPSQTVKNISNNKTKEKNKTQKLKHQDIIDRFIAQTNGQDGLRIQLDPSNDEHLLEEDYYESEAFSTEEDIEKNFFFSQTLANIYIKQKKYERAYEIIKHLSLNYPEKSIYFADQLSFLDKLIKHKNINK